MPGSHAPATRRTAQKDAIRSALDASTGFLSAPQVHRLLQEAGTPVGLATVYRQLNTLAQVGAVDTVNGPDGQLFRTCRTTAHHHHLICESCGKAEDLEVREDWIRAAAASHGFTVTRHVVEVFGLCADCASRQ
ncbi:Fur family transcriptional regulator [Propionicimonas sp.]|uniref:Fur family transcriptional regulator n=1 Tax=Propionicimonas sp. TaxID=1955623 RepID=UPI0039E2E044